MQVYCLPLDVVISTFGTFFKFFFILWVLYMMCSLSFCVHLLLKHCPPPCQLNPTKSGAGVVVSKLHWGDSSGAVCFPLCIFKHKNMEYVQNTKNAGKYMWSCSSCKNVHYFRLHEHVRAAYALWHLILIRETMHYWGSKDSHMCWLYKEDIYRIMFRIIRVFNKWLYRL